MQWGRWGSSQNAMGQAEGGCVSQNAMGQAGVVCIPECNRAGRGWCVSQHATGQAECVCIPACNWVGRVCVCIPECNRAGSTHPTGMHLCFGSKRLHWVTVQRFLTWNFPVRNKSDETERESDTKRNHSRSDHVALVYRSNSRKRSRRSGSWRPGSGRTVTSFPAAVRVLTWTWRTWSPRPEPSARSRRWSPPEPPSRRRRRSVSTGVCKTPYDDTKWVTRYYTGSRLQPVQLQRTSGYNRHISLHQNHWLQS